MEKVIIAQQDNINNDIIFNILANDEKIDELIIKLYDLEKYKDNLFSYLGIAYSDKIIDLFLLGFDTFHKNILLEIVLKNKNNLNLSLVSDYLNFLKDYDNSEYNKIKGNLELINKNKVFFLSDLKTFSNEKLLDAFVDTLNRKY